MTAKQRVYLIQAEDAWVGHRPLAHRRKRNGHSFRKSSLLLKLEVGVGLAAGDGTEDEEGFEAVGDGFGQG